MTTTSQLPDAFLALQNLSAVPDSVRDMIADCAAPWSAVAGDQLVEAGEPCPGLPLLASGELRVSRRRGRGRGVLLYRVRPGELCPMSAISALGRHRSLVSLSAEGSARGVFVPSESLRDIIADSSEFRDFVFEGVSARMAEAIELIEDLAFGTVEHRVARWLLSRSTPITVTHSEIADDVGTAREVVSRILKDFENQHVLSLRRGEIWITKRDSLAALLGSGT